MIRSSLIAALLALTLVACDKPATAPAPAVEAPAAAASAPAAAAPAAAPAAK